MMDPDDKFQCTLAAELAMEAFVIVPLIVKGGAIGVLVVDNIANKREITYKSIDSITLCQSSCFGYTEYQIA